MPDTIATGVPVFSDAKNSPTLIAAAYYPDWSADSYPPEQLDYSKFDLLYYAFAIPNVASGIDWDENSQDILRRLVNSAHNSGNDTRIVLSIGGWGGSHNFSTAVSSENRWRFVEAAASAVKTFGLDGIDIDWEYPNSPGAGNHYAPSDASNLLHFFTELRDTLGPSMIISAAVSHEPWLGHDGNPLNDVSEFAAQLTTINIMNYDVWGASAIPGPNAPLSNACGNSKQPQASAAAAVKQWSAAGFPSNKMLLGLPLYGYVSNSQASTLSYIAAPPAGFTASINMQRVLRQTRTAGAIRETGNSQNEAPRFLHSSHSHSNTFGVTSMPTDGTGDLSPWWGQQIAFRQLVASGALVKLNNETYGGANGYTEGWDDCSDTPFLFNHALSTVVTYDDTYSLADKAAFARDQGLKGCFTWSLDQDDGVALQNTIRQSLGK